MTHRVSDRVAGMIDDAIERLVDEVDREHLVFDVGMGGNQTGPVVVIGFWLRWGSRSIHVSAVVNDPPNVDQGNIDQLLPRVMETLGEERTRHQRADNGEAVDPRPQTREVSLEE